MDNAAPALVAVAPTRLDFGGGWTDVPPYPEERGGFVCNIAITRYATARVAQTTNVVLDDSTTDLAPAIVRAALARHGDRALSVSLASDYPQGAGLGGSSAAGVALIAVLRSTETHVELSPETRSALAEESRAIEVEELGIPGGRQDHYAAAHGGALGLTFDSTTHVHRITLAPDTIRELETRCIVGYTGQSRISGDTITAVLNAYTSGNSVVSAALARMKSLAMQMRDALTSGDIDALGAMLDEHWVHQRSLHPAITTERIDALERAVKHAGAAGMKALGASGGGCVMVIARKGEEQSVLRAMRKFAEPVSWRVATHGVVVREETGVVRIRSS